MKEMQFQIRIKATRQKVWQILWQDETFRQWAGIIDPGTHIVGELKVGSEAQFISASGYGVTSLVEELKPDEYMLFKHSADTQHEGKQVRKKEWTGGEESYLLTEEDTVTTLTTTFDVPLELEEYFKDTYPKALEKIKELAEKES